MFFTPPRWVCRMSEAESEGRWLGLLARLMIGEDCVVPPVRFFVMAPPRSPDPGRWVVAEGWVGGAEFSLLPFDGQPSTGQ